MMPRPHQTSGDKKTGAPLYHQENVEDHCLILSLIPTHKAQTAIVAAFHRSLPSDGLAGKVYHPFPGGGDQW